VRLWLRIALPLLPLLLLVVSLGCELERRIKTGEISYTNETDERLFVHFNDEGASHALMPNETSTISFILPRPVEGQHYDDDDDPVRMNFYDEQGCDVLTIFTTVRKIREEHESSFVIVAGDIAAPQDRYDCDVDRLPLLLTG